MGTLCAAALRKSRCRHFQLTVSLEKAHKSQFLICKKATSFMDFNFRYDKYGS
jgi:hypothetical protein